MEKLPTVQQADAISERMPVPVGAADAFTKALERAVVSNEYTGAVLMLQQERLVGMPFVVTAYAEHEGVGDASYVFVRCILPNGSEIGFTDGGMAIGPVMDAHAATVGISPDSDPSSKEIMFAQALYCPRGLRESAYKNKAGIEATTFWIG